MDVEEFKLEVGSGSRNIRLRSFDPPEVGSAKTSSVAYVQTGLAFV